MILRLVSLDVLVVLDKDHLSPFIFLLDEEFISRHLFSLLISRKFIHMLEAKNVASHRIRLKNPSKILQKSSIKERFYHNLF